MSKLTCGYKHDLIKSIFKKKLPEQIWRAENGPVHITSGTYTRLSQKIFKLTLLRLGLTISSEASSSFCTI